MRFEEFPRRVWAIFGCWALLVAVLWCQPLSASAAPPASVRLVVDYGDGVQVHFNALAWQDGMTVIDALKAAQKHPHGVTFSQRGSGSTALVTQIGDLKNEKPGKANRNSTWMYWVNKTLADVGAGSYSLHASDVIVWKYTTPSPTETPDP
jgi:hypothetical protein